MPAALVVFLRLPIQGKVKTRIAATLGNEKALSIYESLYKATLHVASNVQIPVYLFYEGGLPATELRDNRFNYHEQRKGPLDQKIYAALSHVHVHHPQVIIIGSDCPELSVSIIEESHHQLKQFDTVVGPATDGGFYLFGCKNPTPELFTNINWSTSSVLSQLIDNIRKAGLSYTLLSELSDIDTATDWEKYIERREKK